MKKIFTLLVFSFIFSCSTNTSSTKEEEKVKLVEEPIPFGLNEDNAVKAGKTWC